MSNATMTFAVFFSSRFRCSHRRSRSRGTASKMSGFTRDAFRRWLRFRAWRASARAFLRWPRAAPAWIPRATRSRARDYGKVIGGPARFTRSAVCALWRVSDKRIWRDHRGRRHGGTGDCARGNGTVGITKGETNAAAQPSVKNVQGWGSPRFVTSQAMSSPAASLS
jgi:hypothetical protein